MGHDSPKRHRPSGETPSKKDASHRIVLLTIEGKKFRVENMKIQEGPLPRTPTNRKGKGNWNYEALGGDGTVIGEGAIAAPSAVHGEFPNPQTGNLERVEIQPEGPQRVQVRVPVDTRRIRFFDATPDGERHPLGEVSLRGGTDHPHVPQSGAEGTGAEQ